MPGQPLCSVGLLPGDGITQQMSSNPRKEGHGV